MNKLYVTVVADLVRNVSKDSSTVVKYPFVLEHLGIYIRNKFLDMFGLTLQGSVHSESSENRKQDESFDSSCLVTTCFFISVTKTEFPRIKLGEDLPDGERYETTLQCLELAIHPVSVWRATKALGLLESFQWVSIDRTHPQRKCTTYCPTERKAIENKHVKVSTPCLETLTYKRLCHILLRANVLPNSPEQYSSNDILPKLPPPLPQGTCGSVRGK